MLIRNRFFASLLLPGLLLVGCGGGDSGSGFGYDPSANATGDPLDSITTNPTDASNRSYVPLVVFEAFDAYSGMGADDLFSTEEFFPFIESIVISPVNATTLEPIVDAVVEDFKVTVDDIEISADESFPILQKVIGSPTYLQTALVFDVSGSMGQVDIDALVAEAKAYVAAAKASSNPTIANQLYTVWVFGQSIEELTNDFTGNTAAIETALDAVVDRYNDVALSAPGNLGTTSNLHRAIVQAIGRYTTTGTPAYNFGADGVNDLVDEVLRDYTNLSQLVIFSSGGDTFLEMSQDQMTDAIQSQSFISYDLNSTSPDGSVKLYKPVFYYVVGGAGIGEVYSALSTLSEATTQLVLSGGAYSFSAGLVQNQIDAIERRIDEDNKYVFSYAFAPRIGDHTAVFSSKSENFNYSLTQDFKADDFVGDGSPGTPAAELPSLVEITGPNGEYLAAATASLAEVSTFAPATRWINTSYGPGDYTWTPTNLTGVTNADGTYTVTAITGTPAILRLDNSARLPIVDFTTIIVTN